MSAGTVVKLDPAQNGDQMLLVVDFTNKKASVVKVSTTGNISVTDVQDFDKRGA